MPYEDVLDVSIVLSNILIPDLPFYKDFAGSVCGFVFNIWPGLKYVNNKPVELIKYLGTNNITCKSVNNKIDFKTEATYGINGTWNIPKNGIPNRYGESANYIGYFENAGQEKIVIYGFFDDDGILMDIPGSLSDPVIFYFDNLEWIYRDIVMDPDTNTPITIDRNTQFPMISGCRIDILPSRNDCIDSVIQKYFDFTSLNNETILGDIPMAFLSNGVWYWDYPGVWPRINQ